MVKLELRYGNRVVRTNGAEEVPGLVLQLIEAGTDGQVAVLHNEPPCDVPVVRVHRA